jgi:CBS domain-containing protein
MSASDAESPREGYLKVTYRRVRSEDADSRRVLGVFCPRRTRAVDLRECRTCDYCQGLCLDPTDRQTFLRCSFHGPAGEALDSRPPSDSTAGVTPVGAIMSAPAECVTPETSIAELSALLLESAFGAAPVIDERGRPIGIVSKTDALRCYHEGRDAPGLDMIVSEGPADAIEIGPGLDLARLERTSVRDIMTHAVFTLSEEASISRAAALMAYEGVHRIVVTDASGRALGVVSSLDIMRWLARRDGYVVPDLTRLRVDAEP